MCDIRATLNLLLSATQSRDAPSEWTARWTGCTTFVKNRP